MRACREDEREEGHLKATLLGVQTVVDNGQHTAFTSLCRWQGRYYLAFRQAMTHNIVPPGHVAVWRRDPFAHNTGEVWLPCAALTAPQTDLRDPKLIPSDEALYCLVGAYLPNPAHRQQFDGLSNRSSDNLIQTLLCYTTDGTTWSPWVPILRPLYWGWSILAADRQWFCVSYHCGQPTEAQSLVVWAGPSLFNLVPLGTIYEGISQEKEGRDITARWRYPSLRPSEAILYAPSPQTLACLVRTGDKMEVGVSRTTSASQDWRWSVVQVDHEADHHTTSPALLHPSAIIATPQGWLLAARCCWPMYRQGRAVRYLTEEHTTYEEVLDHYEYSTRLYHVQGQYAAEVLRLPSGGDTGYAEICAGEEKGEYLVSYYSQHLHYKQERFEITMPGSSVHVATIRLDPDTCS